MFIHGVGRPSGLMNEVLRKLGGRPQGYFKGDLVEYTGKTMEHLGKTLYEQEVMEGPRKGEKVHTYRPPTGPDPFVEQQRRERNEQQEQFRRLREE